jgi:ADP-ribosylglycohydrolase
LVRLEPGRNVSDAGLLSRAQGCLFGQVAGDSLGSLVEFASSGEVAERYPDGPRRLEDGGTWNTIAGQPTDDSEMALALSRSILAAGRYEPERAFRAYQDWQATGPFDIGNTVRAALGGTPRPESLANGSLMRASPLAVFSRGRSEDEAAALGRADSALTHPNPICGDAVAAFVSAIRHGLLEGDGPEAAYAAARRSATACPRPEVAAALDAARREPPICDGPDAGVALVALQNAFFELLRGQSLEDALVATVRRGGDTDTNAAIAGALLGAVHGRDALPLQWRVMVLSCRAHPLRAPRPRPMTFWPIDVMEQAERLLLGD